MLCLHMVTAFLRFVEHSATPAFCKHKDGSFDHSVTAAMPELCVSIAVSLLCAVVNLSATAWMIVWHLHGNVKEGQAMGLRLSMSCRDRLNIVSSYQPNLCWLT